MRRHPFFGVAATERPIFGRTRKEFLHLGSLRWRTPFAVLANHAPAARIGEVDRLAVSGGRLLVSGWVNPPSWLMRGEGFDLSINAAPTDFRRISAGESAEFDGLVVLGPAIVLLGAVVDEISIVMDGADRECTGQLGVAPESWFPPADPVRTAQDPLLFAF